MRGIMNTNFNIDKDKLSFSDILALDRTILSNERTFLAYVRTAITLLISGVGIINLFEDNVNMKFLGLAFIILSIIIFIIMFYKYLKKRKYIYKLMKNADVYLKKQ